MLVTGENININFNSIPENEYWSIEDEKELKVHKIHAYPAKFPSFVIKKSIEYAQDAGIKLNTIADIFCGCGTTAFEAKRNGIGFWGCDINPVATLIARVKSNHFDEQILLMHYDQIILNYSSKETIDIPKEVLNNDRINYWFPKSQIKDLYKLLISINETVIEGIYRDFFHCAFSNILKSCSRWLTKSIKPQIDPDKKLQKINIAFEIQFNFMLTANKQIDKGFNNNISSQIQCSNFLDIKITNPFVDMLITSPPYVTSYEYADLHQLSTLWLGYCNDYRELRQGTIGSVYHSNISPDDIDNLNNLGKTIYKDILKVEKGKAKSVAKYFIDMKYTVQKSYELLNPKGLSIFVIGNTKYKGVEVDNAKFLTHCMIENGFENINIFKRKIGSKILSPYRDSKGKFSNDKRHRQVYSYEFVIIGQKS